MVRGWLGLAGVAVGIAVLGWLVSSARAPATGPERRHVPTHRAAQEAAGPDLARWRAAGLREHEIDTLLFASVEREALARVPNPWETYWHSGRDAALRYALGVAAAYERVRRELEALRGPAARHLPAFARAFRPLDAELGFLSSEEQIELQARRLEARAHEHVSPSGAPAAVRADPALDFLTPAAAFEVRLRQSVEAEQLRDAGVDLDEAGFREALALLLEMRGERDLSSYLRAAEALRSLLGPSAFLRVQAASDPLFALIASVARAHGQDESAVEAAYAAVDEAQRALLAAAAASPNGHPEPSEAAAVARREREQLAAAVGETTAAAIADAQARLRREQNASGGL
jgi:hypothetical protein